MGELLPSKANPTEAQTMEYFQWDNKRPGFCVQNLVQQSYHLLSDTISDHSEYDIYALHPSHNRRWEGGGNISCFLPNSIHSLLPQSDPLFGHLNRVSLFVHLVVTMMLMLMVMMVMIFLML